MPVIHLQHITRNMVQANRDALFVFGDNMKGYGRGGQAAEMRGEPNAVGIPTKWYPARNTLAYFSDLDADSIHVHNAIQCAFDVLFEHAAQGGIVYVPEDGVGTGLSELSTRAPRILALINYNFDLLAQVRNEA